MTKVRQIFKAEDDTLMRQAHIQIDIYSVVRDDSNEAGIDWSIAFESLSNAWGATLSSPATLTGALAGGMSTTIMQNTANTREFANSKAILKLLNAVGTTAKHAPVSLVAMNRQWARKTNLKTDGYLERLTQLRFEGCKRIYASQPYVPRPRQQRVVATTATPHSPVHCIPQRWPPPHHQ